MNGTGVFLLIGSIVIGRFFCYQLLLWALLQVSSGVNTIT